MDIKINDFIINNNVVEKYTGKDRDVIIPDTVTEIGDGAFLNNIKIETVQLPSALVIIHDNAFAGCENLKKISLPHNLFTIGDRAFLGCENLGPTIEIPFSVEKIGKQAFSDCKNIRKFIVYENTVVSNYSIPDNKNLTIYTNSDKIINYINSKNTSVKVVKIEQPEIKAKANLDDYDEFEEELNNNQQLNEYYSKTMPTWLRGILDSKNSDLKNQLIGNRNIEHRRYGGNVKANQIIKNNEGKNIAKFYTSAGKDIDLANANFISGDVPTSKKDPRLNPPNIPFFYVKYMRPADSWEGTKTGGDQYKVYKQVYAIGLNDDEPFRINRSNNLWSDRGTGNKRFKYVPLKTLLPYVVDFCYIDTSDPANLVKDKRAERKTLRDKNSQFDRGRGQYARETSDYITGHYDENGNYVSGHEGPKYIKWYDTAGQDKSGYELPDPQKYRKMLDEIHATKYREILDKYYNTISDARQYILNYLAHDDTFSRTGSKKVDYSNRVTEVRNALGYLEDAIDSYSSVVRFIDTDNSRSTIEDRVKFIFGAKTENPHLYNGETIVSLRRSVKRLQEEIENMKRREAHAIEKNESLKEDFSFDDDIYYESDFGDNDVQIGAEFDADGVTYIWLDLCSDEEHLGFDTWQVWSAENQETGEEQYFVVDPDNGFIDWGPCDTAEEAIEFLNSKVADYEAEEYGNNYEAEFGADGYRAFPGNRELEELDPKKKDKLKNINDKLIADEEEAIDGYTNASAEVDKIKTEDETSAEDQSELNNLQNKFEHIKSEEQEHIDELNEASYGGAYDIADNQYFTKEEVMEFGQSVVDYFNEAAQGNGKFELYEVDADGLKTFTLGIYNDETGEVWEQQFLLDGRKIKKPSDLNKYFKKVIKIFAPKLEDSMNWDGEHEGFGENKDLVMNGEPLTHYETHTKANLDDYNSFEEALDKIKLYKKNKKEG